MELPEPLDGEFWTEVKQYEEKEHMPFMTTPERFGRAEAFAESIETILEIRFPAVSSQLMSEVRQIHDHERLKKILRAAATISDPDELRKYWANGADGSQP